MQTILEPLGDKYLLFYLDDDPSLRMVWNVTWIEIRFGKIAICKFDHRGNKFERFGYTTSENGIWPRSKKLNAIKYWTDIVVTWWKCKSLYIYNT